MEENNMIEKMAKLMQMSNAVTYEPNARQIELSAQPTREKYYVTANNGHLTINYTSLGTLLYNAGYRKQEWISVDERLPEDADERVLVYIVSERSYTELDTDRFVGGRWVRWGNDVTHWMPLPKPPETKGETE